MYRFPAFTIRTHVTTPALILLCLFVVSVGSAVATTVIITKNPDNEQIQQTSTVHAAVIDDYTAVMDTISDCGSGSSRAMINVAVLGVDSTDVGNTSSDDLTCLQCHSNAGYLIKNVTPPDALPEDGCATATSRPAFLNSFVNPEFTDTVHGKIGCTGCHGGDGTATTIAGAHKDMSEAEAACDNCHADVVERHASSLHNTLNGMKQALLLRSGEQNFHALEPMWEADCGTCHAGCSDCHITQPDAVGGGLLQGHSFFKLPPMEETCAACHGSRAGGEYIGKFEGVQPDVHYQAGMHCTDCHKNDLHGDGVEYSTRWEVAESPSCTDCHAGMQNQQVPAHSASHEDVSCQSCHAQTYQNCFGCHATEEDGKYVRRADKKTLDFKLGNNTVDGYAHSVVPLRSNPVSRDSFNHYGKNLLPNFDQYPTWKTAAPHNIVKTPVHGKSCNDCHSNTEIFLRGSDLDPHGSIANEESVLDKYKDQ